MTRNEKHLSSENCFVNFDEAVALLYGKQIRNFTPKVVAIATETVYGLAALASDEEAVNTIYRVKKRPQNNPLILHACSLRQLNDYVEVDLCSPAKKALFALWPAPLTLVLPRKENIRAPIATNISNHLPTLAVRIPDHTLMRSIIEHCGPIVAPSANLSGLPSPTLPKHIFEDYNGKIAVLQTGEAKSSNSTENACEKGIESTILREVPQLHRSDSGLSLSDGSYWTLLRPGSMSLPEIARKLGMHCTGFTIAQQAVMPHTPTSSTNLHLQDLHQDSSVQCSPESSLEARPQAPGQYFQHYTPHAPVHLASNTTHWSPGEAIIGVEGRNYEGGNVLFRFNPNQPHSLMPHYYRLLREVDSEGLPSLWIDDLFLQIQTPAWQTLKERFFRSSTP